MHLLKNKRSLGWKHFSTSFTTLAGLDCRITSLP